MRSHTEHGAERGNDPLLWPLLRATHEADREIILGKLISEHAAPIIKGIIRRKLGVHSTVVSGNENQEAEDVYGDAIVHLVARLNSLKSICGDESIGNFAGYVAVIAYNACHLYLRRKYPQRWLLKNRIRYLLTHREHFSVRQSESGELLFCGLSARQAEDSAGARSVEVEQLRNHPELLASAGLAVERVQHASLDDLLKAILKWAGGPVELDALVITIAGLQGIRDEAEYHTANQMGEEQRRDLVERLPDARVDPETEVERRLYFQRLWAEICALPIRQRGALLLNLRNAHDGVIALLPLMGVASIRQIAEAVEVPPEEFAQLWNDLPLEDAIIAERLKVTRQQVINLRKSAKERLGRRMKALDEI